MPQAMSESLGVLNRLSWRFVRNGHFASYYCIQGGYASWLVPAYSDLFLFVTANMGQKWDSHFNREKF